MNSTPMAQAARPIASAARLTGWWVLPAKYQVAAILYSPPAMTKSPMRNVKIQPTLRSSFIVRAPSLNQTGCLYRYQPNSPAGVYRALCALALRVPWQNVAGYATMRGEMAW